VLPYDATGAPAFTEDVPHSSNEVAEFGDLTYTPIAAVELSAGIRGATLGFKHAYVADGWINGVEYESQSHFLLANDCTQRKYIHSDLLSSGNN